MENTTKQTEEKVESLFEEHQEKTGNRIAKFEKTLINIKKQYLATSEST